jgi:hypothetical protein
MLKHQNAEKIFAFSQKLRLKTTVMKMHINEEQFTSSAFRTAYYLAMNNKQLSD